MTLYEITGEVLAVLNAIDGAVSRLHGEHPELSKKELISLLQHDFSKKILSYAKVRKNCQAEEKELAEEIKHLQERKKAVSKRIEAVDTSMKECMMAVGKTRVKGALFSVELKELAPKLVIDDESQVPDAYLEPQKPKVDKKGLNKWAKENDVSEFGHFEPNFSLTVQ